MFRLKPLLLITAILFLGGFTGGYWGNRWYIESGNSYFHLAGGLVIALLTASYYNSEFQKISQPLRFFCILAIVMGVGVLWEFHEYLLSEIVNKSFMGDLPDTIKDLLMDTLGGALGAILDSFRRQNAK